MCQKQMRELKTLKDIEPNELEDYVDKRPFYDKEKLKQEAIKQIKQIRNAKIIATMTQTAGEDIIHLDFIDGTNIKVTPDEGMILKKLSDYKQGKCDIWIQDFFNITDEDLK